MVVQCMMGCGRSKSASTSSLDDKVNAADHQSKRHGQRSNKSSNTKHGSKQSKKENNSNNPGVNKTRSKHDEKNDAKQDKLIERLSDNTVNGTTQSHKDAYAEINDNSIDRKNAPPNSPNLKLALRDKPNVPPPLAPSALHQAKMSNSQIEFFKMLDEKIEQGDDYSEGDSERAVFRR